MSKQYQLNKTDLTKIATGAAIAVGAALVTYLTPVISDIDWTVGGTDYTPFAVAVWSIVINVLRKAITVS